MIYIKYRFLRKRLKNSTSFTEREARLKKLAQYLCSFPESPNPKTFEMFSEGLSLLENSRSNQEYILTVAKQIGISGSEKALSQLRNIIVKTIVSPTHDFKKPIIGEFIQIILKIDTKISREFLQAITISVIKAYEASINPEERKNRRTLFFNAFLEGERFRLMERVIENVGHGNPDSAAQRNLETFDPQDNVHRDTYLSIIQPQFFKIVLGVLRGAHTGPI